MAVETTAAAGLGIKSGLLGACAVTGVSLLAVVVGFTVVPLTPGKEHQDATRRLAAGLLSSFTLGPFAAIKYLQYDQSLLLFWVELLRVDDHADNILWAYVAAAVPFVALTALIGFWLVASVMFWFEKRKAKDIGEMISDVADQVKELRK